MEAILTPSWKLTTDHAASSYGQPVLINPATGEVFGPGDVLRPYPQYGFILSRDAVRRMAKTTKLDEDGQELVAKFCNDIPEGS